MHSDLLRNVCLFESILILISIGIFMAHFYSEPWFAHHLGKLQSLGVSDSDCSKITGLNIHWMSQPLSHRNIPQLAGNRVIQALYDAGYHARHEVREIANSFQLVDFHKAFLFNSANVDSMLQKIQSIVAHDLSGNHYSVETRNGMLYLYHSCDHAKYDYLTPQGHFAFYLNYLKALSLLPGNRCRLKSA